MSFNRSAPVILPSAFPDWVVRKVGTPLIAEADFQNVIGFKWGTFVEGTSTVTSDTDHYFGGTRSVKMTTDPVVNINAELKINLQYLLGEGKYSFEQKWAFGHPAVQSGLTNFDIGIEPRQNLGAGFWQGRIRYFVSANEWRYESGVDVYTPFATPLVVERPLLDAAAGGAGDQWGWARIVIDTKKKEYVLFETIAFDKIITKDMRGIPLVNRGAATKYNLLVFALIRSGANLAETARTTDWCISKLDDNNYY